MAQEIGNFIDRIQIGDDEAHQIAIGSSAYGICNTNANESSKTVNIPGFTLNTGTTIHIKFNNENSASSPTLNVSNTGAKAIMQYGTTNAGTAEETSGWRAGAVLTLTYDGTNWVRDQGYNTNTKYSTLTQALVNTGTETTGKLVTAKIIKDTVTNAINDLDVTDISGFDASKTLKTLKEENGKIAATFQDINITKSQVSDFPSTMTPASHIHGNLQNNGTLQTNDITIADGDKLIVTDASDSNKVARTSIEFDGSTTTKALTQKGTWETFNNYSLPLAANGTRGGVQIGYSENGKNYPVELDNEKMYVNVPWTDHYAWNDITGKPTTISGYGITDALPLAGGIMTGNIRRYYESASTEPMITMLSNNLDIILWEAGHGSSAAATTTSNHYKLLYKGTGTDAENSNYLQLIAHKSSDLVAVQIDEVGNVSLPQMNKGSATKPIYLNNGVITEGTQIGASAYHADSYFAVANHGNHVPETQTANNITFLRNDNSWFKLTKAEVNTLINLLDTGSSDLTSNDYVITQYVGGGTTTTTYHRRPASKVVNATLVKAALGTNSTHGNAFLRKDGTWQTPPYPVTSVNGYTGAVSLTASDLGLSNALHFIGTTSTALADGDTTATLTAKTTNSLSKTTGFVNGDVVMDGDQLREYVWVANAWHLLGFTTSTAYSKTATGNSWITSITQGTDGRITATTGTLDTTGSWTGKITRAGISTGWNKGRDNALIWMSALNDYSPAIALKTKAGSWDIGTYDSNSYQEDLIFSYVPDTLYNGTNTTPTQIKFLEDGHIVGALDGNASTATTATNLANNPSIQTSGTTQITITAGGKTSSAYTIPYATSAGSATSATTATYIKCTDTRSTTLNPTDLTAAQGVRFDFKTKSTINLTATDTYAGVMSFRPYGSNSDWSGGNAHQLAFNSEGLHWRNGGASWGNWYQILDSNNTASGTNNAATLTWNTTYTIAKINDTDIKFTTMAKPSYAFTDLTAHPTTLSGYGITDAAASTHNHNANDINDGILDTARLPSDVVKTYSRNQIGTAPNFDSPGINGYFEIRNSSETTQESGLKPFNGWGNFLNLQTNVSRMQIAGTSNQWYIRGTQSGSIDTAMSTTQWNRIVLNSGSWDISITGTAAKATADASGNTITSTYAPLASPALTGTPTAPTAANGTNTTQIATTAFVNNTLSYINAMRFKGTLGTGGTITTLPASHEAGDTYRVITPETYAGKYCEVGTLIICVKDGTAAADTDWTSVETNEDGAVIGPTESTNNAIVRWSGTSGRIIKNNSNVIIDDNGNTTIGNSSTASTLDVYGATTLHSTLSVTSTSKLTEKVGIGTDPDSATTGDVHILTIKGNTRILNSASTVVAHIDTNTTSDSLITIHPHTPNTGSLGTSTYRWAKLYIGTSDSYGDVYTPIYWNEGVPATVTPTQRLDFEFNTTYTSSLSFTSSAITLNTEVSQIVVTSGVSYLNSEITWTIAANSNNVPTLTLSATTNIPLNPENQKIEGYIILAHTADITSVTSIVSNT